MYLDFEDYRPETPRVSSPISVREAVMMSLIFHLVFLLVLVLSPKSFFQSKPDVVPVQQDQTPLRFVDVEALNDKSLKALLKVNPSDLDRRSSTVEKAPVPDNPMPFSRGNTPEFVQGGPKQALQQAQPDPPAPPTPPAPETSSLMDLPSKTSASATPTPAARPANRSLGDSLRNLQQYLHTENYDNIKGGNADQSADIQFDSMGVDFGPWLRRFKNQVERNWLVPISAMNYRGSVVIQFNVLRNGTITDLNVIQPAGFPSLTSSALNALKLSNPTSALPPEYPAEKVFFTVSFHYNEDPPDPTVNVLVAVVGPTATGKSALGLALATAFDGEVLACDSTAVYRGIDIGTDKVPLSDQRGIPHHLVDLVGPAEVYSAARYGQDAAAMARTVIARGRIPILVGGTGFYYRALIRGIFPGPARDEMLRARLEHVATGRGVEALHRWLRRVDPPSAERIQPRDRKRLIRALEVYLLTGRALTTHFDATASPVADFKVLTIGLSMPRQDLLPRVRERVDRQFAAGVVAEVRGLLDIGVPMTAHALSGLVYRQVLELLQGTRDEPATRALIVQENMRYAKRQTTWFRAESGVHWLDGPGESADATAAALSLVKDWLARAGLSTSGSRPSPSAAGV